MFEKSEAMKISSERKLSMVKYAAVFTGGLLLGYGIKKALDSGVVDEIMESASSLVAENVPQNIVVETEENATDEVEFEDIEIE